MVQTKQFGSRYALALCAAVALATVSERVTFADPPAAPPKSAAAPKAAAAPKVAAEPKAAATAAEVAQQLRSGETALAGQSYVSALEAFQQALKLDPKNAVAARGVAYALIRLGRARQAVVDLDIVSRSKPAATDAGFAVAQAAAQTAADAPIKAIPALVTCLDAGATAPVDESVLNALGTALNKVKGPAGQGEVYRKAVEAYKRYEKRLTDAQPGKLRWGVTWGDAAVVQRKVARFVKANGDVATAVTNLNAANARMVAVNATARAPFFGFHTPAQKQAHHDQMTKLVDAAQAEVDAAVAQRDDAQQVASHTEAPPFPDAVNTDDTSFSIAAWLPK